MLVGELMQALEMMKTHVQRVTPETPIRVALDMMDLYQTPALPVVNAETQPIGILTEGDVARFLLHAHDLDELSSLNVEKIATYPVFTVVQSAMLAEVCPILLAKGFKRTPVVSEEGVLIGTLSRVDLLQWTLDQKADSE